MVTNQQLRSKGDLEATIYSEAALIKRPYNYNRLKIMFGKEGDNPMIYAMLTAQKESANVDVEKDMLNNINVLLIGRDGNDKVSAFQHLLQRIREAIDAAVQQRE